MCLSVSGPRVPRYEECGWRIFIFGQNPAVSVKFSLRQFDWFASFRSESNAESYVFQWSYLESPHHEPQAKEEPTSG